MNEQNSPQQIVKNNPVLTPDIEGIISDNINLYTQLKDLKEEVKNTLKKVEATQSIVYLGFLIIVVMLVAILFAVFPAYENYFFNSYLYQYQVTHSK